VGCLAKAPRGAAAMTVIQSRAELARDRDCQRR